MAILLKTCIAGIALTFAALTCAQTPDAYPSRPVKLVTWSAPGGTIDIFARLIADHLSRRWNQQVVVENKVGAGGAIASDYVAKSKPDGYMLFLPTVTSQIMNPLIKAKLPYDPVKDFEPVSQLVSGPYALVAAAGAPFNNMKELIAYSRTQPKGLSYGTAGPGSAHQLIGEFLNQRAGARLVPVPYKTGEMGMFNDMMGGSLQAAVWTQTIARNMLNAGKIKVLGVTGARRNSALPDSPTLLEQGFPGFEVTGWIGLYGPAGVPKAIVDKVAAATREILRLPEVQVRMDEYGFDTITSTPDEFRAAYQRDYQRWGDMVKAAGIVPE